MFVIAASLAFAVISMVFFHILRNIWRKSGDLFMETIFPAPHQQNARHFLCHDLLDDADLPPEMVFSLRMEAKRKTFKTASRNSSVYRPAQMRALKPAYAPAHSHFKIAR